MWRFRSVLRADDLMEAARRRISSADFGDIPFQTGLEVFLRACAEEADLSLFGQLGTRWDILRFLTNLLRMSQEEQRAPEILQQRVERPIFITGVPRSGTTFLHQLLTADSANIIPRVWQLIHPYVEANRDPARDTRQHRVARQLWMFQILTPEFRRMHPIKADSPQECSEINAHIFASLRFDSTYAVPSYRKWLDEAGHFDAYRFHRRFLQHLQHQSGDDRRWVLKCPDHIFALDTIRAIYPDARFVFVHRDPLRVLASVARLTEVLRRPFTRHVDRPALGHQELERWSSGTELMIRAADEDPFAEPIFHVQYSELVADPLGTVEALYRHFGLTLDPAAASAIARMVEAKPNGGYGTNHAGLDAYRIDSVAARERFAPYLARFGIAREPTPAGVPRPQPSIGSRPVVTLARRRSSG